MQMQLDGQVIGGPNDKPTGDGEVSCRAIPENRTICMYIQDCLFY